MTTFARQIRREPWGSSFWMFVGMAFLYGVVHALGPGHGKSVVFAYFMGKKGSIWKGLFMGHLFGSTHAFSSVIMVYGTYLILEQTSMRVFDDTSMIVQRISYAAITLIGAFLTIKAIRELRSGSIHSECACHHHADNADLRSMTLVSIGTGLIPCPGAAIILTFAITLGVPHAGLAAMVTLALGMGLTTSMVGVISIISRKTLAYAAGHGPGSLTKLYGLVSISGAACITLLGAVMLSAVW